MKNMKLEAKHIRLIATVASIAVFLYVFLVVYDDYSKKTEETKKQYDMVQRDISTRQQALDDEPRIVEEVNKRMDRLNSHSSTEDSLLWYMELVCMLLFPLGI